MKILLTRHAQTKENELGIIQDGKAELSEKGITQLIKLKERLSKEKIDKIFSSDYNRCIITSDNISQGLNIPIEFSKDLREKNDGDWVGKSTKEVNWDSLEGNFETRKAPNGESLVEVRDRWKNFYNRLKEELGNTDKTILIVSHATILRIAIGYIIGLSLEDSIFNFVIDNCSVTEIEINQKYKKEHRLNYLNEKSFL